MKESRQLPRAGGGHGEGRFKIGLMPYRAVWEGRGADLLPECCDNTRASRFIHIPVFLWSNQMGCVTFRSPRSEIAPSPHLPHPPSRGLVWARPELLSEEPVYRTSAQQGSKPGQPSRAPRACARAYVPARYVFERARENQLCLRSAMNEYYVITNRLM